MCPITWTSGQSSANETGSTPLFSSLGDCEKTSRVSLLHFLYVRSLHFYIFKRTRTRGAPLEKKTDVFNEAVFVYERKWHATLLMHFKDALSHARLLSTSVSNQEGLQLLSFFFFCTQKLVLKGTKLRNYISAAGYITVNH